MPGDRERILQSGWDPYLAKPLHICPGYTKIVEYPYGLLQRRYGLPSDMPILELQFKLRCVRCNCRSGFRISIINDRMRTPETRDQQVERVLVAEQGSVTVACLWSDVGTP
jgi:hypothetical protein